MSAIHGTIVVGVFDQLAQAQSALAQLREAGFAEDEIGLVTRQDERHQLPSDADAAHAAKHRKVVLGAESGALAGAGLGSLLAFAVSSSFLPVVGPVLAGGVLAALVAGTTGAAAGGLIGALVALGLPEHEASCFEPILNAGRVIVTVHTATRQQEAADLLNAAGAEKIAPPDTDAPEATGIKHMHFGGHATESHAGGITVGGGLANAGDGPSFHTHQEPVEPTNPADEDLTE